MHADGVPRARVNPRSSDERAKALHEIAAALARGGLLSGILPIPTGLGRGPRTSEVPSTRRGVGGQWDGSALRWQSPSVPHKDPTIRSPLEFTGDSASRRPTEPFDEDGNRRRCGCSILIFSSPRLHAGVARRYFHEQPAGSSRFRSSGVRQWRVGPRRKHLASSPARSALLGEGEDTAGISRQQYHEVLIARRAHKHVQLTSSSGARFQLRDCLILRANLTISIGCAADRTLPRQPRERGRDG